MKIKELFNLGKNVNEIEKPKTNIKLRDFLKTEPLKVLTVEIMPPNK